MYTPPDLTHLKIYKNPDNLLILSNALFSPTLPNGYYTTCINGLNSYTYPNNCTCILKRHTYDYLLHTNNNGDDDVENCSLLITVKPLRNP